MRDNSTDAPRIRSENVHIYTVSEINQDVRRLLETGFPTLWIEGEISNFTQPSSGHWYFTLKDANAQVRCAMFKNRNSSVSFSPKQGDHVVIRAKISLYEARGEYQIIAEHMEEAGYGALQRAFEALKAKLQKEGLFDSAVKKPLPTIPQQIGVITSPTGAAIRDILSVLKRRFPCIPVLIYPVAVQGEKAAPEIVAAIEMANRTPQCDVLILARGGGSIEDLWAFNEEIVARAIFHSTLPIVSAVGHEIDFTIADFVADKRAPTPSAAAELVTPDQKELLNEFSKLQQQLLNLTLRHISQLDEQIKQLRARLIHPKQRLMQYIQRLDDLELRLIQAQNHLLSYREMHLAQLYKSLQHLSPEDLVKNYQSKLEYTASNLKKSFIQLLKDKRNEFVQTAKTLNTVSPLATLERGYAIVNRRNEVCIIRSYQEVNPKDEIKVTLANGHLLCTVDETIP